MKLFTHSCRSEETLKFAIAGRNGTPQRAVVNQAKGLRDRGARSEERGEEKCDSTLHVGQLSCNRHLRHCVPLCPPCCSLLLPAAYVFLGIFHHFWLLFFGEANSRRKLQTTKVNAKSTDRAHSSSKEVVDAEPTPGAECQCHILCQKCTQTTYPIPHTPIPSSPRTLRALLPSNVESYCTLQMNNLCARSSADGWSWSC